jgi:hypothetical protein
MTKRIKRLTAKRDECAKQLKNWYYLKGDPKVLAVHRSNLEFELMCIDDYINFQKRWFKFRVKLYSIIALIVIAVATIILKSI